MCIFLQSSQRSYYVKKCLTVTSLSKEWLLSKDSDSMMNLKLILSTMSLTEHVYTFLTIQSPWVTMKINSLIDSGASVNFISVTFIWALSVTVLNSISLRVMSANELKISSAENGYFYSLSIAVNERTLSTHLFHVIDSPHWMILNLS